MTNKIRKGLIEKAFCGILIDLTEYIQIPILQYSPRNIINQNPFILLKDINSEYKLVKGKAGEINFWEKIKFMFEQEKVEGYKNERVYPINEKQAIVEVDKNHATLYCWGPDITLNDDEKEWLWDNAEEYALYIDRDRTNFYIYVVDINK